LHWHLTCECALLGCAPNGLFVFRSKIFGGLSAEVTTIFNTSNIAKMATGDVFFVPDTHPIFHRFVLLDFKLIPHEGLADVVEIFLADSAYSRAMLEHGIVVRIPTPLPENGERQKVSFLLMILLKSSCTLK
jgi:hypothetical protein